jgi:hypothetical protein
MTSVASPIPLPPTSDPRRGYTTPPIAYPAPGRPHILLDPDLTTRPLDQMRDLPKMSAGEQADRICAVLLRGTGPILLCLPGTASGGYQTAMLSTARAFIELAGDSSVSIATLPYPNGPLDVFTRLVGFHADGDYDVLEQVLLRLKKYAGGRPILLTGESQGAWVIADTLRRHPDLAGIVTRVAMFAKPGFVRMPGAIGQARHGAAMLRATGSRFSDATGIVEFRHIDDIVPSLFTRMGSAVAKGEFEAVRRLLQTGHYVYPPHHYEMHGEDAARWLYLGERPQVTVQMSAT